MEKEQIIQIAEDTFRRLNKTSAFTDRKLSDTPTDAFQVVNRQYADGKVVTLTDAPTVTLNAGAGFIFDLLAAGDRTIAVPTGVRNKRFIIRHKASGADRTLSLTTGSAGAFRFGTTVSALTATTSGKSDYIACFYNSTDDRWDVVSVSKGY